MSPIIGIVADDLTSAADGAGPFVARGLSAVVGHRGFIPDGAADAVSIDVASRSMPAGPAGRATADAVSALRSCAILYKTVDSTLRGHIREELAAACKAAGRRSVVIAPAFPAAGRTTREGIQLVEGVPVSATTYGRDPVHPARTARIADLVPPGIGDVAIVDAAAQSELDRYVAACGNPQETLWVGSPGLALALAARFPIRAAATGAPLPKGRVLVVAGSANPISRRQAALLSGLRDVVCLLSPADKRDDADAVLARLARDACTMLEEHTFAALIATGGDTMAAILGNIGVRSFVLSGELEAGFPFGIAKVAGKPLTIAMKAGGFGEPETLLAAARRFRRVASADALASVQ